MKILVLSDSHSSLYFMRAAIAKVRPNAVVHLGDYYEDGEAMAQENPRILFHMVPGNCDQYRPGGLKPAVLCYNVCGLRLYMTHGHNHKVKLTQGLILKDARQAQAQAVLYGHTHRAKIEELEGCTYLCPGNMGFQEAHYAVLTLRPGDSRMDIQLKTM